MMITELDKEEFSRCRKLLHPEGQLEAAAVIEGTSAGRVFADDRLAPSTGLIWLGNNDGFIFIGDENNENFNGALNAFIDRVIKTEAIKVQLEWFEAMGNYDEWNKTLKRAFACQELGSWKQRVYKLKPGSYSDDFDDSAEEGYEMIRIKKEHFVGVKNEFLQEKISLYWPAPETFLKEGIGYASIYEDEIVSVCFSGFVAGNVHGIDIETLKPHQGKRLAQSLARKFVQECLQKDIIAYWDCMKMNKPSIAVAERLGFTHVSTYTGFEFPLK